MADETTVEVAGEEVRISSPGRVVFPTQGWTKLQVIEHFLGCAEGALRGIEGRPTMLKRYMKGVDDPPVYHKRAAKNTPFETVDISFPSQRPGVMNVPRTEADVIRLAQLGCLDFHPWPVRADDIDHPDEWRIDFDPTPGFGFEDVRRAVAGAKEILDEIGAIAWPKTSGSRGIHVYVRLEPIWDFIQVRRAGLAFARESGTPDARPRHHQVVEGGTIGHLHRLQPDGAGQDGLVGIRRPAHRLHVCALHVGRARRRPPRGLSDGPFCVGSVCRGGRCHRRDRRRPLPARDLARMGDPGP